MSISFGEMALLGIFFSNDNSNNQLYVEAENVVNDLNAITAKLSLKNLKKS